MINPARWIQSETTNTHAIMTLAIALIVLVMVWKGPDYIAAIGVYRNDKLRIEGEIELHKARASRLLDSE